MAEKQPPLANLDPMRVLFLIPQNDPPELSNAQAWSPEFNDFIAHCLINEPYDRSSAQELLTVFI